MKKMLTEILRLQSFAGEEYLCGIDNDFHLFSNLKKSNVLDDSTSTLDKDEPDSNLKSMYSKLESVNSLEELKGFIEVLDECSLKETAVNTVFADGNPNSDIMVIGEAPGKNEDEQGIPFCGRSGKLLDSIMSSVGLSRNDNFYITNIIPWRPPANRKPTKEETGLFLPIVEKHISLVDPKIVILAGSTPYETLLNCSDTISKSVGKFFEYKNVFMNDSLLMVPIFHPSFLLRQPLNRKTTWFNMLEIKKLCQEKGIL